MKIAIYGVSRSGKDYLIERVVDHLCSKGIAAIHIKGSATLNDLAEKEYGKLLRDTNEAQKNNLRKHFIDLVSQMTKLYEVIFVDGHYAFIDENDFNIVFTEADKYCYDHFFYLDTLTEKIIEFSRKSIGEKQDLTIQASDIDAWKTFEKQSLASICEQLEKELVILDEDIESCIQFISLWITEYTCKFDYPIIANNLVDKFIQENNKKMKDCISRVMLLDCDNTLSINDITYDFCDFLEIDKSKVKQIFAGNRYTSYQFFKINKLYQCGNHTKFSEAIDFSVSRIEISKELWSFIGMESENTYIIAVTAGLLEIWRNKIKALEQIDSIIGNTFSFKQDFFVTPLLKKYLALAFQARGFYVLSIGDSIIDIPMLEISNQAHIVAHKKINQAVWEFFESNSYSKITQIFTNQWRYPIAQFNGEK